MTGEGNRTALITGGAGFIGSNLTQRLLQDGDVQVRVFDNLSRRGVFHNVDWLRKQEGAQQRLEVVQGDVRDFEAVKAAVQGATEIYHLAAQVAVTTSVNDPASDFAVNALGTLHVLEAARQSGQNPFLLYTSTNKVYGSLEDVPVEVHSERYRSRDPHFRGVVEEQPLDFHSPYGCSKGAADQYVRDYARIYQVPTVVFRMSCIAGPSQFGNEDQGWVAHFLYSALAGTPITIYGDGCQVRDVLHVHDLVDAMIAARTNLNRTRGQIYNLGGGMDRVISVVELLRNIEQRTGKPLNLHYDAVRPGDQPLYIADTSKLERDTGWRPQRSLNAILQDIEDFWHEKRDAITTMLAPSISSLATEFQTQEVG